MKGYVVTVYKTIKDEDVLKKYAVKAREAIEKNAGKFLLLIFLLLDYILSSL